MAASLGSMSRTLCSWIFKMVAQKIFMLPLLFAFRRQNRSFKQVLQKLSAFILLTLVFSILLIQQQRTTPAVKETMENAPPKFSLWQKESFQILEEIRSDSEHPRLSESIGEMLGQASIVINITKYSYIVPNITHFPVYDHKISQKPRPDIDSYLAETLNWSHEDVSCESPTCFGKRWCPAVPYKWRVCNVSFTTYMYQGRHHVDVFINDRKFDTWDVISRTHLTLLKEDCTVQKSESFTSLKSAEQFVDTIPRDMITIGSTYGLMSKLLRWKLRLTSRPRCTSSYFYLFVKRVGYPGWENINLERIRDESNRSYARPLYFGKQWKVKTDDFKFEELPALVSGMSKGHWSPQTCRPRWRLAIILPYRDREAHLRIFIRNMANFLQKQMIDFTFFVVEQLGDTAFNRAALMNIGFVQAMKLGQFDCLAFHDVDLIPEDYTHLYGCSKRPRHLVAGRNSHRYILRYPEYFGGAIMLRPHHVKAMNGFTNKFFGWGGEDDNAYMRVRAANLSMVRFPNDVARYTMLEHNHEAWNPHMQRGFPFRWDQRQSRDPNSNFSDLEKENKSRSKKNKRANITDVWDPEYQGRADGLHSMNYTLISITDRTYFIHISVDLPGPQINDMLCLNSTKAKLTAADRQKLCNGGKGSQSKRLEDALNKSGDKDVSVVEEEGEQSHQSNNDSQGKGILEEDRTKEEEVLDKGPGKQYGVDSQRLSDETK